jgi:hypothetical protein
MCHRLREIGQSRLIGWLLRGEKAPPNLRIATPSQVRRCRVAFDHVGISRSVGLDSFTYGKWLENGTWRSQGRAARKRIPANIEWRRWLYGGPCPNGVLIVTEQFQLLKHEFSQEGICGAARIDPNTVRDWKRKERHRIALAEVLELAKRGGNFTWHPSDATIIPRTIDVMTRYAKAATTTSCCRRVSEGCINEYTRALRQAEKLGAKDTLIAYLHNAREWQGANAQVVGFIDHEEKLFVASPGMLKFRSAARRVWAEQEISRIRDELKGLLDEWFLDWTSSLRLAGSRPRLVSDGMNGSPANDEAGDQDNGKERVTAGDSPIRRGRRKTKTAGEIEKYCSDEKSAGHNREAIADRVRKRFERPNFTAAMVTIYANRYDEQKNQTRQTGTQKE